MAGRMKNNVLPAFLFRTGGRQLDSLKVNKIVIKEARFEVASITISSIIVSY